MDETLELVAQILDMIAGGELSKSRMQEIASEAAEILRKETS